MKPRGGVWTKKRRAKRRTWRGVSPFRDWGRLPREGAQKPVRLGALETGGGLFKEEGVATVKWVGPERGLASSPGRPGDLKSGRPVPLGQLRQVWQRPLGSKGGGKGDSRLTVSPEACLL